MSEFDYLTSLEITRKRYTFDALIMAVMRQADNEQLARLCTAFPEVLSDLELVLSLPGMAGRNPNAQIGDKP